MTPKRIRQTIRATLNDDTTVFGWLDVLDCYHLLPLNDLAMDQQTRGVVQLSRTCPFCTIQSLGGEADLEVGDRGNPSRVRVTGGAGLKGTARHHWMWAYAELQRIAKFFDVWDRRTKASGSGQGFPPPAS